MPKPFVVIPRLDTFMRNPYVCEWFALCERTANYIVSHPIIGDVPTCHDCIGKLSLEPSHVWDPEKGSYVSL